MSTPSSRKGSASANPTSHSSSKRCQLPARTSPCDSALQSETTRPQSVTKPSVNRLKPAKRTKNRVPPPQQERILQKHIAGKSIVEISAEEKRNRETISKIVRGPEMEEFVRAMRERFYALGHDAINAVQYALTEQKDGRLGFQLLVSIGVVASPEERQLLAARQAAAGESKDDRVKTLIAQYVEIAFARARDYGTRCPEIDKDLEKVGGRINYATGKIEPLEKKTPT